MGSIPGRRTKIPCSVEQLSPSAETAEAQGPRSPRAAFTEPAGHSRNSVPGNERARWMRQDPAPTAETCHGPVSKYGKY